MNKVKIDSGCKGCKCIEWINHNECFLIDMRTALNSHYVEDCERATDAASHITAAYSSQKRIEDSKCDKQCAIKKVNKYTFSILEDMNNVAETYEQLKKSLKLVGISNYESLEWWEDYEFDMCSIFGSLFNLYLDQVRTFEEYYKISSSDFNSILEENDDFKEFEENDDFETDESYDPMPF